MLTIAYEDSKLKRGRTPSAFSLAYVHRGVGGELVRIRDLLKYQILEKADILESEWSQIGVPAPELARNVIISNGITIFKHDPFTSDKNGQIGALANNLVEPVTHSYPIRAIFLIVLGGSAMLVLIFALLSRRHKAVTSRDQEVE